MKELIPKDEYGIFADKSTNETISLKHGVTVESHPRTCIIVGSSNSDTGFLRDITGNRRAWKRIRDRYIKAHPLCEECKKQGRLTPAEEVHHVKPLSNGGDSKTDNLMALCKPCHSRITLEANKNNREL